MDLLNLQGKLTLDTSEYEAAIQRAVQLGGSTFTSSMQGATGSAANLQAGLNSTATAIDQTTAAIGNQVNAAGQAIAANGQLSQSIGNTAQQAQNYNQQSQQTTQQTQQTTQATMTLRERLAQMKTQYEQSRVAVANLTQQYLQSAQTTGADSEATRQLSQQLAAATTYSDILGNEVRELENQMEDGRSKTSQFAEMIKNAATVMLGNLFTQAVNKAKSALVSFAQQSISTGMSFDSAMSQVAATMGVTSDQVQELREYAEQMGATTAFSATQSAEALNYMALAGYDAEKSMKMLPNVLNLAASGGMQLGRASDMVTDAQSALGLSLEQTTEMVNQMAMAASKSNTSVEQLGDAILQIGGTAKKLKGGTTELATILGILADNGMKGAEGGTHLRNMMNSLMSPTKSAKEMMSELNISLYDADGNMRSLNDVFIDMRNAMAQMATQEERDKVVSTIFNARDMKAAEALLAGVGDRYQQLSGYIDQAADSAQNMADTRLDNLQGDITLFKSAVEGAQIAVSEKLTPSLRKFTQFGSKAVSEMSQAFKESGLTGAIEAAHKAISESFNGKVTAAIYTAEAAIKAFAVGFAAIKAGDAIKGIVKTFSNITAAINTATGATAAQTAAQAASTTVTITNTAAQAAGATAANAQAAAQGNVAAATASTTTVTVANTAATTAQTAAQTAGVSAAARFGAALSAVGTAASAAAVVGTAIASMINSYTDAIDEVGEVTEGLAGTEKEFADSIYEAKKALAESEKSYKSSVKEIEIEEKTTQKLVDRLYELNSSEEKTVEVKNEMSNIVEHLNSSIEGLNVQYDKETGLVKTTRDEIDKLTESYFKQAKAQAYQDIYSETVKKQTEAELALAEAQELKTKREREYSNSTYYLQNARDTLAALQAELSTEQQLANIEFTRGNSDIYAEHENRVNELTAAISEQEKIISDISKANTQNAIAQNEASAAVRSAQSTYGGYTKQLQKVEEKQLELTGTIQGGGEEIADTMDNVEQAGKEVTAATEKQAEKVIKSIEDIAEAYDKALENRTGTFEKWAAKGLEVDNSEAVKAAENTAKQAAEALKKQLTAEIEQSNDAIQSGLKQMDSIMDDYYSEVQSRVSTLNSWVDKNINVDVNADGEITFEDMDNALNETRYKLNEWSKDIAELSKRGISEGLLQQLEEAGPESEEKVKALLSASQKDLERYSENWEKAYSQIPDVANEQLEKLKSETEQQVSELTNSLIAQSPEFRDALANVGFEAGQGYISALRGQTDEISQVVQEMFNVTKEQIAAQTQTESIIDPELTLSDLQTALDTTQKGFEEWANNIDELSKRGISQGLLQELEDAGPESADKVKALLSATDPELKKYSKAWEQLHKDIKSTAETQLSGLKESSEKEIGNLIEDLKNSSAEFKEAMETVGVNVVDGYLDGIRSKLDEVKEVMKELYNEGTQGTVEDEAEISSPSKAMRRIGKYIGEGFALGIADEKNDVMSASKLLTESAISPMDNLTPVVTKGGEKSAYSGAESITGAQQQQYVFNLVTPDGNLVGRWIAPFVDAVQGQMMAFSTEGYAT